MENGGKTRKNRGTGGNRGANGEGGDGGETGKTGRGGGQGRVGLGAAPGVPQGCLQGTSRHRKRLPTAPDPPPPSDHPLPFPCPQPLPPTPHATRLLLSGGRGQGRFLVRSPADGAGSYSVAHKAGLLPTELTGMWGWILRRSPHRGRGSPPAPAPTKQRPARHPPVPPPLLRPSRRARPRRCCRCTTASRRGTPRS